MRSTSIEGEHHERRTRARTAPLPRALRRPGARASDATAGGGGATSAPRVLAVLAEGSGHGYELMQRIEDKSEGAWRPRPARCTRASSCWRTRAWCELRARRQADLRDHRRGPGRGRAPDRGVGRRALDRRRAGLGPRPPVRRGAPGRHGRPPGGHGRLLRRRWSRRPPSWRTPAGASTSSSSRADPDRPVGATSTRRPPPVASPGRHVTSGSGSPEREVTCLRPRGVTAGSGWSGRPHPRRPPGITRSRTGAPRSDDDGRTHHGVP